MFIFSIDNPSGIAYIKNFVFCEIFHKESHELFNEERETDEGYPYFLSMMRCNKCKRTWHDPGRIKHEEDMAQYERKQNWGVMWGTEDQFLGWLCGKWVEADKAISKEHHLYEDKFFVFHSDLKDDVVFSGERKYPSHPAFESEQMLLTNYPIYLDPMHPAAKEVWDKRKVNFSQFLDRLKIKQKEWLENPLPIPHYVPKFTKKQ